ncbi:MAG: MATE family efflux transporter [Dehalococcoidales bacterium]|nr:MAG: MATE family efflux transporter [Dehalococcoidales bacterium]
MGEMRGPGERRGAIDRDWTKGSIAGNLLSLAWPMIVSGSLTMLGPTIDMIWVGKLGAASIAGVGVAGMAVMLVNSTRMGLSQGMRAIVARYIGADDIEGAKHAAQQAFVISSVFAITMAAIGILLARPILIMMGLEVDVVDEGADYMRIMFVGSAALSFRMMAEGIMQASGDAITPMKISFLFRFFHVALCPFLVFGWWIFPRMGVSGAAVTNVFSQSLGTAIALWFLLTGRTRIQLTLRNFRLDFSMIWRIVKIGIPASVTTLQHSLGNFLLMYIIVAFGTLAVAANTLVQRIEMMLFMPCMGFGQAAGILAGQNLGAEQPGRAEKSGWLASGIVTGFMLVCSVAILIWPQQIIGIFNTDPGLIDITTDFLRIAVVGYSVFGLAIVFQQCLSGAGDTVPPMIFGLVTLWLIQLPLAYFLPKITDLGVYGVRWGMVAGIVGGAIASLIYFRLGRWKRKQV